MSIDALTTAADGQLRIPKTTADWDDWVSASSTRNHVLDATLLDWLHRHGTAKGYAKDGEDQLDQRTDFLQLLLAVGE